MLLSAQSNSTPPCIACLFVDYKGAFDALNRTTPPCIACLFVDYKGAFDALNRTTLGRVLGLFLSPAMVRRVMCLYFDAKANVKIKNVVGPVFDLLRGVRQGCPASPSFFTVALAFVSWTFQSTFQGIKLVNLYLSTIEYADDQMLFTLSPDGLQEMLTFLSGTALPFGLRLAPQKCELICFHRKSELICFHRNSELICFHRKSELICFHRKSE